MGIEGDLLSGHFRYEYITPIDTDEVILPIEREDWKDMLVEIMSGVKKDNISTIVFRKGIFCLLSLHFSCINF